MSEHPLDLLVIGGGITGAGIALDAASRGLRVGLVEKQDFAAGTSSRSTKLIHGGLRYLKQGEIRLVREVGRERAILYRNAPHLVIPEKMLLPLVERGTYGKWATSVGLWIYDRLAGVGRKERRVMLSKQRTEHVEPLLRRDILRGAGLYIEYRTDDARLTIEVMKTAGRLGALCVNYAEATGLVYEDGKLTGADVTDLITGGSHRISAAKVVNAAGPWADQLRAEDKSLSGKRLHLTKGVHLVVPHEKLPLKQSVYFDVPDGRMIFAIPRGRAVYVGTTDTNYEGNLEAPVLTQADAAYLLNAVNHMFPEAKLQQKDIESGWAGLRPLIHQEGKSPSELSRKDEIFLSPSGLITIAGGKLTGYRKMAERVVDLVAGQLRQEYGKVFKDCHTDTIVLAGGEFGSAEAIPSFIDGLCDSDIGRTAGRKRVEALVYKYGTNAKEVLRRAEESPPGLVGTPSDPDTTLLLAEADYCMTDEMCTGLDDFFVRRTGMLLFDRHAVAAGLELVGEWMAARLQWGEDRKRRLFASFREESAAAATIHEA
nr:glycerol-3-phosphate dehydrogenase/oxidase [Paenibacillus darwinianus]